jgi:hypothetical protein
LSRLPSSVPGNAIVPFSAIVAGILSRFYVIYFALTRRADESKCEPVWGVTRHHLITVTHRRQSVGSHDDVTGTTSAHAPETSGTAAARTAWWTPVRQRQTPPSRATDFRRADCSVTTKGPWAARSRSLITFTGKRCPRPDRRLKEVHGDPRGLKTGDVVRETGRAAPAQIDPMIAREHAGVTAGEVNEMEDAGVLPAGPPVFRFPAAGRS